MGLGKFLTGLVTTAGSTLAALKFGPKVGTLAAANPFAAAGIAAGIFALSYFTRPKYEDDNNKLWDPQKPRNTNEYSRRQIIGEVVSGGINVRNIPNRSNRTLKSLWILGDKSMEILESMIIDDHNISFSSKARNGETIIEGPITVADRLKVWVRFNADGVGGDELKDFGIEASDLDGISYVIVEQKKLSSSENNDEEDTFWKGTNVPDIKYHVKGRQLHNNTYTDNPVLACVAWLKEQGIDAIAAEGAADYCDELVAVDSADGSIKEEKRYRIGTIIEDDEDIYDVISMFERSMNGRIVFNADGTAIVHAGRKDNIVGTININDCIEPPNIEIISSPGSFFNKVTAKYRGLPDFEPIQLEKQVTDLSTTDGTTIINEDLGMLRGIVYKGQALRYMAHVLRRQQRLASISIKVPFNEIGELKLWDRVSYTDRHIKENSKFRVVNHPSIDLANNVMELTLLEDPDLLYDDNEENVDIGFRQIIKPTETIIPPKNVRCDADAIIQSDGSTLVQTGVQWDEPEPNINLAEVRHIIKEPDNKVPSTDDSSWLSSYYGPARKYPVLPDTPAGKLIDVRVRFITHSKIQTEWVQINNFEVGGDLTPPGKINKLTATALYKGILAQWERPSDLDYAFAKIYMAESKDAFIIGQSYADTDPLYAGKGADEFLIPTGNDLNTKYIWATAFDLSGNQSIAEGPVEAAALPGVGSISGVKVKKEAIYKASVLVPDDPVGDIPVTGWSLDIPVPNRSAKESIWIAERSILTSGTTELSKSEWVVKLYQPWNLYTGDTETQNEGNQVWYCIINDSNSPAPDGSNMPDKYTPEMEFGYLPVAWNSRESVNGLSFVDQHDITWRGVNSVSDIPNRPSVNSYRWYCQRTAKQTRVEIVDGQYTEWEWELGEIVGPTSLDGTTPGQQVLFSGFQSVYEIPKGTTKQFTFRVEPKDADVDTLRGLALDWPNNVDGANCSVSVDKNTGIVTLTVKAKPTVQNHADGDFVTVEGSKDGYVKIRQNFRLNVTEPAQPAIYVNGLPSSIKVKKNETYQITLPGTHFNNASDQSNYGPPELRGPRFVNNVQRRHTGVVTSTFFGFSTTGLRLRITVGNFNSGSGTVTLRISADGYLPLVHVINVEIDAPKSVSLTGLPGETSSAPFEVPRNSRKDTGNIGFDPDNISIRVAVTGVVASAQILNLSAQAKRVRITVKNQAAGTGTVVLTCTAPNYIQKVYTIHVSIEAVKQARIAGIPSSSAGSRIEQVRNSTKDYGVLVYTPRDARVTVTTNSNSVGAAIADVNGVKKLRVTMPNSNISDVRIYLDVRGPSGDSSWTSTRYTFYMKSVATPTASISSPNHLKNFVVSIPRNGSLTLRDWTKNPSNANVNIATTGVVKSARFSGDDLIIETNDVASGTGTVTMTVSAAGYNNYVYAISVSIKQTLTAGIGVLPASMTINRNSSASTSTLTRNPSDASVDLSYDGIVRNAVWSSTNRRITVYTDDVESGSGTVTVTVSAPGYNSRTYIINVEIRKVTVLKNISVSGLSTSVRRPTNGSIHNDSFSFTDGVDVTERISRGSVPSGTTWRVTADLVGNGNVVIDPGRSTGSFSIEITFTRAGYNTRTITVSVEIYDDTPSCVAPTLSGLPSSKNMDVNDSYLETYVVSKSNARISVSTPSGISASKTDDSGTTRSIRFTRTGSKLSNAFSGAVVTIRATDASDSSCYSEKTITLSGRAPRPKTISVSRLLTTRRLARNGSAGYNDFTISPSDATIGSALFDGSLRGTRYRVYKRSVGGSTRPTVFIDPGPTATSFGIVITIRKAGYTTRTIDVNVTIV